MSHEVEIVLRRSRIGTTRNQRANLTGLGLRVRGASVRRADSPALRGMLKKVHHLVEVRRAIIENTPAKAPTPRVWFEVTLPPAAGVGETKPKMAKPAKARSQAAPQKAVGRKDTKKATAKKPAKKES